jgi:hypothetical protein
VVKKLNGKPAFLVDGKPVDKKAAAVLGILFAPPHSKVTDDDIFGTKERKKVGESWPINRDLAIMDIAKKGVQIEDLAGTTKLEKVFVVDGLKCLKVTAEMETDKFTLPFSPMLKVKKSEMHMSFSGEIPANKNADTTNVALKTEMNMSTIFSATGKPNPQTPEMKISVESSRKQTIIKKKLK